MAKSQDDIEPDYATGSALGELSQYSRVYDPELLYPIARHDYRETVEGWDAGLRLHGSDLWNCYELSYLDRRGKPRAGCAQIIVPGDSANVIESKSLKLYLNSLYQTRFDDAAALQQLIALDLSQCTDSDVQLRIGSVSNGPVATIDSSASPWPNPGLPNNGLLDDLDIACTDYQRNPDLLLPGAGQVEQEWLYSHLLRSNCPVTGQPDWATVNIRYSGNRIDAEGLLRYIVSYREHSGFHEQCVEQIYVDILRYCRPSRLAVWAQYTRRGGIDINPFRSSDIQPAEFGRIWRQ